MTTSRGRPRLKVFKPSSSRKLLIRGEKTSADSSGYTEVNNDNDLDFKSTLETMLVSYYKDKIKLKELEYDAGNTIEYLLSRLQEKIDNDEDFAILLKLPLILTITSGGIEAKEVGK
jgi:hypothetical protein